MYSSVQTNKYHVNYAIHPNIADEYLILNKIYLVKVSNYDYKLKTLCINYGYIGFVDKNKIKWRHISKKDTDYEKYVESIKRDFEIEK